MKTITLILLLTIFLSPVFSSAQTEDSIQLKSRPFQITFLPPMGTNGLEAGKYSNYLSVNLFAGYNGGVSGCEVGGFANIVRKDVYGVQAAGFTNLVLGKTTGCQISGFSNINRKTFDGIQLSGFSNIVSDSAFVFQGAGFLNFVKGKTKGTQIAGFVNISTGDAIATQAAGFINVVRGTLKGAQFAGFCNVASSDSKAVQIAGFSNVTSGNIEGLQISGFINVAKKLKGVQLAPFNYCDSVEKGIPIGVFSIVKNGYRAIDISADETMYVNASFHTGVSQFYNIISVSYRPDGNNYFWGYGYGIGSYLLRSNKIDLNLELTCTHINVDEWWTDHVNLLNKLKFNILFNITDHFSIYGGVNYNVYVTDRTNNDGIISDSGLIPWATYSKIDHNTLVKMYPGFNAGIRIR